MQNSQLRPARAAFMAVALWGLLFESAEPLQATGAGEIRESAALLPPNAESFGGIDVRGLKATPFYQYVEDGSLRQGSNALGELAARTGFDPRKDLDGLLVAGWSLSSAAGLNPLEPMFLVVARGRFAVEDLGRQLEAGQARAVLYRGYTLYQFLPRRSPRSRGGAESMDSSRLVMAVTFLDSKTAVIGSHAAVFSAVDRKLGGGPSLLDNTAFVNRAEAAASSNQIWGVSGRAKRLLEHGVPGELPELQARLLRILGSMETTTVTLNFTDGLTLRAEGLCESAADAKSLGDAARGLIALGRLATPPAEQRMMSLFDRVEISQEDLSVQISMSLDRAEFDSFLELLKGRRNRLEQQAQARAF